MDQNQFIKIGDKKFSVYEFCERLGVYPVVGLPIIVGQVATGGTLEASITMGNPEDRPCVEVNFCREGEPPIVLTHTEQEMEDEPKVRTFLYDRADCYIGHMTHKTCSEEELGDEQLQTDLIASGDPDVLVNVYRENQYVYWWGLLNNSSKKENDSV